MMLILLAGLQSLSNEQLEASQIDGANPFHILRYIVIPHLRRYIEIAVLMENLVYSQCLWCHLHYDNRRTGNTDH